MDLLTWLRTNEPNNLIRLSGNSYCTAEHDSLKISNGKWYWFSRGFGGVSALDYLIKVKEMSLPQAVQEISGTEAVSYEMPSPDSKAIPPRKLLVPELEKYPSRVKQYLMKRGICEEVIDYCISHSLLFETKDHHNAMFVGYDEKGQAKYASLRGTMSAYKSELSGSDKHFSFSICENMHSETLHLFESAIDLLSYISLETMAGNDWRQDAYLSLAGVFVHSRENVVPVALETFLQMHPEVHNIYLHLDNDAVGRGAADGIIKAMGCSYMVYDEPPKSGKDVNEYLITHVKHNRRKEVWER